MKTSVRFVVFLLIASGTFWVGCSKPPAKTPSSHSAFDNRQPIAVAVRSEVIASPSTPALKFELLKAKHAGHPHTQRAQFNLTIGTPAISGTVTLVKSQILNRDFLYGADLQYSSIGEEESMFLQSMAIGHNISQFQIFGDRLRLISSQNENFDSNVNHPSQLVQEFPIVAQDATTVTITVKSASPVLMELTGETKSAVRNTWVRSLEFIPDGNYLLIETSVELQNGQIAEFMESVFPRDTLIPAAAPTLLFDDGELEPLAKRYRFIGGNFIYLDLPSGRTKTKVANRYLLDPQKVSNGGQTLDWYVTSNAPKEYLAMIKAGVEGWNRYTQKMWNRDLMNFKGQLPEGIRIGDPRFNVINWDSAPDSTAAYETAASDPLTGIQSHSLIYLPYSWIKVGKEYWTNSADTQTDSASTIGDLLKSHKFMGRELTTHCLQDTAMVASLSARRSPQQFANALLKQVLFHEVGHSLGLAHNFKGSLSMDPAEPSSPFSSSIMDYNQYQLEGAAYDGDDSTKGILLEYDRQILSVLYNHGSDVAKTDPVVPTCSDDEADDVDGGVDPFCIRYDAGKDPSDDLIRTIQLTKDPAATLESARSLPHALVTTLSDLPNPASIVSEAAARKGLNDLAEQMQGVIQYYLTTGAQSVSSMTRFNIRMLYTFKDDKLLYGASATAVRDRAAQGVVYAANLKHLEPAVTTALHQATEAAQNWLQQTVWYQTVQPDLAAATNKDLLKKVTDLEGVIETVTLSKLRGTVLTNLKRVPTAPFFLSPDTNPAVDYERMSIDLLSNALTQPLDPQNGGKMRPVAERVQVATALLTFGDTELGREALEKAQSEIQHEISGAKTALDREELRKLLHMLSKGGNEDLERNAK